MLATLGANVVLAGHGHADDGHHGLILWPLFVIAAELLALGIGLATHHWLHRAASARNWALSRLIAEINRSVRALGTLHLPLDYLFRLRLPEGLGALLRTLNILHLHSTRAQRDQPCGPALAAYLQARLRDPDPKKGQIAYYRSRLAGDQWRLRRSNRTFVVCSAAAILATGLKLLTLAGLVHLPTDYAAALPGVLGVLAVVLPVLAVGALSWAAAHDYEGRIHSFQAICDYLDGASAALDALFPDQPATGADAPIDAAAARRVIEGIELELLGETAQWYTRRAFAKVT